MYLFVEDIGFIPYCDLCVEDIRFTSLCDFCVDDIGFTSFYSYPYEYGCLLKNASTKQNKYVVNQETTTYIC